MALRISEFKHPYPFDWTANFKSLLGALLDLHTAKAHDYVGGGGDPLANYRIAAMAAGTTTRRLMLGRIQEKVTRLANLLDRVDGRVRDERIHDTLMDIANIALLIRNDLDWEAADSGYHSTISASLMARIPEVPHGS